MAKWTVKTVFIVLCIIAVEYIGHYIASDVFTNPFFNIPITSIALFGVHLMINYLKRSGFNTLKPKHILASAMVGIMHAIAHIGASTLLKAGQTSIVVSIIATTITAVTVLIAEKI